MRILISLQRFRVVSFKHTPQMAAQKIKRQREKIKEYTSESKADNPVALATAISFYLLALVVLFPFELSTFHSRKH